MKLRPGHGWRTRPGCKTFVADRGAVRFDYPKDWVVAADNGVIHFHDHEPPADSCRLSMSYLRLPQIDWSGLKLPALLETGLSGEERRDETQGPIIEEQRGDLHLAWREISFVEPSQSAEARSRVCVARRRNLQCLITCDFWSVDLERCDAVWRTVLDTLELDEPIADPSRGPIVM